MLLAHSDDEPAYAALGREAFDEVTASIGGLSGLTAVGGDTADVDTCHLAGDEPDDAAGRESLPNSLTCPAIR